jgi:hypothetical protein
LKGGSHDEVYAGEILLWFDLRRNLMRTMEELLSQTYSKKEKNQELRKMRIRPISFLSEHDASIKAIFININDSGWSNFSPRDATEALIRTTGAYIKPTLISSSDLDRISSNLAGGAFENPSYFAVKLHPDIYKRWMP